MKILFAASECVPFIKTGGLADVVGALPKELRKQDCDVRVVLPLYSCLAQKWKDLLSYRTSFYMDLGRQSVYVGVMECEYEGIRYYFIDNQDYFTSEKPYQGMPNDLGRFAFFAKAALSILPVVEFRPDLIHCHDWQTGLVPVYLNDSFQANPFFRGIRTVMTIHNLKFQGIWNRKDVQAVTGLSDYYFTPDKLEFRGDGNLLKGGLVYADAVTTVSKTYASEILYPYYGEGLEGLMNARKEQLTGIVNGIDTELFDPEADPAVPYHFSKYSFRRLKRCDKQELQKELGLAADRKAMLIGIVSRLTDQKGFDLIARVMDELCQDAVQFAVLGTGDAEYENMFRHYAWKYPGRVSANIYYNEELSHRIYAGCDAFLMPSRFEPCGLSQLIALRYGTLPIVRETGGLSDTVQPYNEYEGSGNGFSFRNYNAHEMMAAVRYAEHIYFDRKVQWNRMVVRAMECDFSWKKSAGEYLDLYRTLAG